jgi:hypothetical protein
MCIVATGPDFSSMLDFGDKTLNTKYTGDKLHRSVKLAMDSGEATTPEEAMKIFEGYRLGIEVGADVATSPTKQAALLTAVNAARRCFLGGVEIRNCPDSNLLVPWRGCRTLGEAVADLQGTLVGKGKSEIPTVAIGGEKTAVQSEFAVRATFDGWCGGVVPIDDGRRLDENQEFAPAGVLAGSIAVSEAFQFVRGRNTEAGRRAIGLSLWRPEAEVSWLDGKQIGPALKSLPSRLWLIGLGHLGQAFLWTLGFLPYADPSEVLLVLQDFDTLVVANDSTSPLTRQEIVNQKKTRAMAHWCQARGFHARIYERRFAENFTIDNEEPQVALCGVDNETARAAMEDVGFTQVIEAGLGLGTEEFLAFQMHSFPASRSARARWGASAKAPSVEAIVSQPAYKALAEDGLDECGLTLLAGRSVGAAFVGTTVSAIVVAELLRMAVGDRRYEVIDGSLRSLANRQAVVSQHLNSPFNPGLAKAV